MSRMYSEIDGPSQEFIQEQKMFFVATAPASGRVNVSPKGMDTLRVLSPNQVCYLDLTGSGNETAAHVRENGRMTLMFMSFDRQPMIMRLYGTGRVVRPGDDEWPHMFGLFPALPGVRQIFVADIGQVQTSCGYGVPEYDLKRERPTLNQWAEAQGSGGLAEYWSDHNLTSIDGLPTGLQVEQ